MTETPAEYTVAELVHWWRDGDVAACGQAAIPGTPKLNGRITCAECFREIQREGRGGSDTFGRGAR